MISRQIGLPSRAIGVIVPSSNRIVERVCIDILTAFPGVDACFARVPYFGNGNGQPADGYDEESFLAAAETLAHARVEVICWNATRGAALGFEIDRALCASVKARTDVAMVTTALASLEALAKFDARRIALVTHGTPEQGAIFEKRFADRGIVCKATLHLGFTDNFEAAHATPGRIVSFAKSCAKKDDVEAFLIWSTNLPGYTFATKLEAAIDLPVLDSATIGVWAALRMLGIDVSHASDMGRIFR